MSTVKVINVVHPSSSTNNIVLDSSGNASFGGTMAMSSSFMRNRILNGAMVIDQRNAGASVTPTADGQYGSCDRWNYWLSQSSKFSAQQSATAPTGFSNSLLVTSLSAYSVTGNDYFSVNQKIEGFNFADLMWGTANAQTVTVSFWVRSSLTGTFGGAMTNSAFNRSYPFSYTVSSANTWEQKSVTIVGDTTGTWVGATNGVGAIVQFSLGAVAARLGTAGAWAGSWYVGSTGSQSVVGTNGATFYITGVQLEVGSVATPFEREIYSTTLAKCQRYYEKSYAQGVVPGTASVSSNGGGVITTSIAALTAGNSGAMPFGIPFKVTKRAAPTIVPYDYDGTANACRIYPSDSKRIGLTGFANILDTGGYQFISFDSSGAVSMTAYTSSMMFNWTASAEL